MTWRFGEEESERLFPRSGTGKSSSYLKQRDGVEGWGACQCQDRQAEGECGAACGLGWHQLSVGMNRLIKI